MRILVTGGAGFIGSATAEALLSRGCQVTILDNLNDYYNTDYKRQNLPPGADFIHGDVRNADDVKRAVQGGVDVVCHFAARAGVRPSLSEPLKYYDNNVMGSLSLYLNASCPNIVYASSSSVYGDSSTKFLESEACNEPISPYAASKKGLEEMSHAMAHVNKWKMIGLRFFTVYGPKGRPDMAPYKFVSKIARGEVIHQHGNGNTHRDYTYIDDIVSGVVASIYRVPSLEPGTHAIYNLGNGTPISLSHFIGTVERVVGRKAVIKVVSEKLGDVKLTNADITKARRDLGYEPQTSIETGIRKLWDWYKRARLEEESDAPNSQGASSE